MIRIEEITGDLEPHLLGCWGQNSNRRVHIIQGRGILVSLLSMLHISFLRPRAPLLPALALFLWVRMGWFSWDPPGSLLPDLDRLLVFLTALFSTPAQGSRGAPSSHVLGVSVCTLLSRDSKASEVEDFELFMPEGAAGRGRARSVPWLPALMTGFQGLAALLMFVLVSPSFCTRWKRETCVHNSNMLSNITELSPHLHVPTVITEIEGFSLGCTVSILWS